MKTITLPICILFFSVRLFAQSGPGGVGNSATNLVWLDASAIATSTPNGAAIASWADLSGNNNHFTQATPSKRPIYKVSDINSKPSLSFSSHGLVATSHITGQDKTTFFVLKPSGAGNSRVVAEFGKFRIYSRVSNPAPNWVFFSTGANIVNSGQNLGSTASIIGTVSSSISLNVDMILNNTTQNLVRGVPSSNYATTTLGGSNGLVLKYAGTIAEMAVYNGQLHSAGITIVNNYFSSKYGIAIANDKYAYDGVGENRERVFGIGRDNALSLNDDAQGNGILRINTPSSLDDGDYLLIGDNNGSLQASYTELPLLVTSRYAREWRVDKTGDAGSVTLIFDVSSNELGNASRYVLLRDNDGSFTDATVSAEVAKSGSTVTFTGIDFTDGEFFTLGNKGNIESVQDGSWQDASTWDCNCVPTINDSVQIISPHLVTIDGNSFAKNLIVNVGATLTFNTSDILSLTRSFENNGTYNAGTGIIEFAGSADQTIGGTTVTTFNTITVNNGNSLQLLNSIALTGELLLTNGNFDGDVFNTTLISNALGTARVDEVPGASTIAGNFIIQRYVPGGNAYWDYLSSPVQGSNLLDWDNEIIMSGVGGADGIAFGGATQYSVRTFDEPTNASVYVTSTARALNIAEGFQVFLGDNLISFAARTFDTQGIPTFGPVTKTLSFTSALKGYNVIGNPYASDIDWASLYAASTNISNQYYIYDKTIKNFKTFVGAGTIPSSQGFMVRATGLGAQVVFNESDKVAGNATWTKTVLPNFALDFKVHEKNNNYGGILTIKNNQLAEDNLDELDGSCFENNFDEDSPNIYTEINNEKLQINTLQENDNLKQIDIYVKANREGDLVVNSEILNNKSNYSCILLEDVSANKLIDLKKINNYDFQIQNKEDRKHFILYLDKTGSQCENETTSQQNLSIATNVLFINTLEATEILINPEKKLNAIISVTNLLGQDVIPIQTKQISEPTKISLNLAQSNSTYIIKVQIGSKVYTNKIIR